MISSSFNLGIIDPSSANGSGPAGDPGWPVRLENVGGGGER